MTTNTITFIGSGNMASSLIGGLIADGYPASQICACDPNQAQLQQLQAQFGIQTSTDNNEAIVDADIIVLAVKPQIMAQVCEQMASSIKNWESKLIISIAAGISVARIQAILGQTVPVIRTMPNTPALLQKGMTGLFACSHVSEPQKTFAGELMSAVGEICWVNTETEINGIIAASGSAPAYFFLFMEAMQESAIKMGFSAEQARLLVQQSALGAAEMVVQNPQLPLATLRQNVTSKGGTTAEAIKTFTEQGLADMVDNAMTAAANRGKEMEKLF